MKGVIIIYRVITPFFGCVHRFRVHRSKVDERLNYGSNHEL